MGIIPRIMTSKTLVDTPFPPLTGLSFLLVFLTHLLFACSSGAGLFEMAELIAHSEHYHRQEVVVMGTVKDVQLVTDRDGQPAFQFFLADGSGTLKVLARMEVQEGDHIIVEGVFNRRRQSGRLTVYNEVKALSIRPLNRFNPDLVG
jgi:hypothetical protein